MGHGGLRPRGPGKDGDALKSSSGQITPSALRKAGEKRLVGIWQWVLVEQMGHLSLAQPWSVSIIERQAQGLLLGGSQLVMELKRWGPEETAPCMPKDVFQQMETG